MAHFHCLVCGSNDKYSRPDDHIRNQHPELKMGWSKADSFTLCLGVT